MPVQKRNTQRIVNAVYSAPWAILPEKLAAIDEVIQLRRAGMAFTAEEVAARLGTRVSRPQDVTADKVALLNLFGTIAQRVGTLEAASGGMSIESFMRAFDAAVADPEVKAIVLNIDSPGGSVYGIQEAADKVFAARSRKRIVAVANSLAASAAYWIGASATEFVITPSGMAGSIGVISIHADESKANDKAGIKYTILTAGKYKAEGNSLEPLGTVAKAAIEERIGGYYSAFVESVARARGAQVAAVKDGYGQGRVLGAAAAVEAGLADRIATLEEILSELGVGTAAASSPRAAAAAPVIDLKGFKVMDKAVFEALIRAGVCGLADADNDGAMATLKLNAYLAGKGFLGAKAVDLTNTAAVLAAITSTGTDAAAAAAGGAHSPTSAQTAAAVIADAAATIQAVEPDRAAQIYGAVELAGFPAGFDAMAFGRELVNTKGLDTVGAFEKIRAKRAELTVSAGATRIEGGPSAQEKLHAAGVDALLARTWGGNVPKQVWSDAAQDFVDWKPGRANYALSTAPRLAAACLIQSGLPAAQVANLSDAQICSIILGSSPESFGISAGTGLAYNSSGMFSNLLLDASNKTLRRSYEETAVTYPLWMKRAPSVKDFKNVNRIIAGEIADPQVIPENGEFPDQTLSDGKETYRVEVWGGRFSVTLQTLVNDDLGSFMEVSKKQGNAMRRKQNKLAYGLLTTAAGLGPTLSDTGTLFNATAVTTAGGHANLTTGAGAPSVTTLNSLYTKMAIQPGLSTTNGISLGLEPKWILFPPALRGTVLALLASTGNPADNSSGSANIWHNGLMPIMETQLAAAFLGSDTAYYLLADNGAVDTCEYAFMQGYETPRVESKASFDRLTIAYRIFQPFGVAAIDYRGMQKHAGA